MALSSDDIFKRVIIAGGRDFSFERHYVLLKDQMDRLVEEFGMPLEIVSGGARGADSLGERYAKENGINIVRFQADWENQGKRAGIARNIDMGNYGDMLVAFWDGESRGTKHMIEFAGKRGLPAVIITYKNNNNNGSVPIQGIG